MRDRDYDHGSRITSHISSEIRFCIRIMSLSSLGTGNEHQKLIDRYGHRYLVRRAERRATERAKGQKGTGQELVRAQVQVQVRAEASHH